MNWRVDLLSELVTKLDDWTPRKWYGKILKRLLIKQIIKEMNDHG